MSYSHNTDVQTDDPLMRTRASTAAAASPLPQRAQPVLTLPSSISNLYKDACTRSLTSRTVAAARTRHLRSTRLATRA